VIGGVERGRREREGGTPTRICVCAARAACTAQQHTQSNTFPTLHHLCLPPLYREEQDLAAGAVMQAVVAEGEGGASPADGDLVRGSQRVPC
jgi:uncharacterized membrane protein YhiD involved in acid resistance